MDFATTPSLVAVLGRNPVTGEVTEGNEAVTDLLGLQPDELLTETALVDRVHRDDRDRVAPATADSDTLVYRLRHANGNHIWVSERLTSVLESGAVISHLEVVEPLVRHAQLQETIHRLTDAIAIFELGDSPVDEEVDPSNRSIIIVASNEAGEAILGGPGTELQIGDKPDLDFDDNDFVESLVAVITTGESVALVLTADDDGAPSTISVEKLDESTAVLTQRSYAELADTTATPSVFAGVVPPSAAEPFEHDDDSVAQSGLLQLIAEDPNPLEVLNGLAEHFASECSTWVLDRENGTAQRTRCDEAAELPEVIEISTAALDRLAELDEPVTKPDPAVGALQRRLGSPTGDQGSHLAVAPLPNGEVFLAERVEPWDNSDLEQLGLVAGFANVAAEASAALVADDAPATGSYTDELLQRERFIGGITRRFLAATSSNLDDVVAELRDELDHRFDVADLEIWTTSSDSATICDQAWSGDDDFGEQAARWVHVVRCDEADGICGAIRFVSGCAQWDTATLQALDAVAELLWQVHARIESDRRPADAFVHAPVAVVVLDPGQTISRCNAKYAEFLGFSSPEELVASPLGKHATVDGRQQIERLLRGEDKSTDDVPFRRKDETIVWGRVRVSTTSGDDLASDRTNEAAAIVHIEDVTKAIMKQRALEYRLEHDDLTLLPTRQQLTTAIANLAKESALSPTSDAATKNKADNGTERRAHSDHLATLLLIDLDTFEGTRSRYGRDQADQVLRVVADRLRTLVRPTDLVARTGPAEFGILLHGDESDASALAERLLSSITQPVLVRNTEISTTANIGITSILSTDQVSSVLRKADNALDAAKGAGRLRSATFDNALFEQLERDEKLEADLPGAIEAGQITMHYQPEVSLRTGELLSFEALARWAHPDFGMLDSNAFIAHAERIGVVRDIDELALETACQQMQAWSAHFPGRVRSLRVNISGTSIRSASFIEKIRETLATYQVEPDTLWFEISEDELLRDDEAPLEQLEAIKNSGCKILIDDFGHGLSSFAVLRRLPVDALEIAPALIQSLGADPDASTIVAATIQLAQTLGLECVAEGVENINQMQELIELGCQRAHGFLYGAAVPANELNDIINEGRINVYDSNEG